MGKTRGDELIVPVSFLAISENVVDIFQLESPASLIQAPLTVPIVTVFSSDTELK